MDLPEMAIWIVRILPPIDGRAVLHFHCAPILFNSLQ
jgi:hypothetical protein